MSSMIDGGSPNARSSSSSGGNATRGLAKWRAAFEESPFSERVPLRLVSVFDENAISRILPELLVPTVPPASMSRVDQIARMVRCVTWTTEHEELERGGTTAEGKRRSGEVWRSLQWLLDVQRGGVEEQRIMASLLLGINKDAYVCIGRLRNCREGQKRHAGSTRERDGSVVSGA